MVGLSIGTNRSRCPYDRRFTVRKRNARRRPPERKELPDERGTKRRSIRRGSGRGPGTVARRRRRAQPPREAGHEEEDDTEQREPSRRVRLGRRRRRAMCAMRVRIGRFSVTCAHDPGCFPRSRRGVKGSHGAARTPPERRRRMGAGVHQGTRPLASADEKTNGTEDARKMGPPCRCERRDTFPDTRSKTWPKARPDSRPNVRPRSPILLPDVSDDLRAKRCFERRSPSRPSGS